jgi:hypothetical protein
MSAIYDFMVFFVFLSDNSEKLLLLLSQEFHVSLQPKN